MRKLFLVFILMFSATAGLFADIEIRVSANKSGVSVYSNGVYKGTAPLTIYGSYGYYRIVCKKAGYYDREWSGYISDNTVMNLDFPMQPSTGSIRVNTNVRLARVYVDGSYKGLSPLTVDGLRPGTHTVTVTHDGLLDETRYVTVSAGYETTCNIDFKLSDLKVITSNVTGASVYLDNTYKGKTPLTITDIFPGNHNLRIEKQHYETIRETVTLEPNYIHTVTRSMVQISGYITVSTNTPNAHVFINDSPISGRTELDEGTYRLKVRAFGYEDYSEYVTIVRLKEHPRNINMKKAAFDINSFSASAQNFYPERKTGAINFSWSVTAPEFGFLTVKDKNGAVVYTCSTYFMTWLEYAEWDGQVGGVVVPDGQYSVEFVAGGKKRSSTFTISSKRNPDKDLLDFDAARTNVNKEIAKENDRAEFDFGEYQKSKKGAYLNIGYAEGRFFEGTILGAEYYHWGGANWFLGGDLDVIFTQIEPKYRHENNSYGNDTEAKEINFFDLNAVAGASFNLWRLRPYASLGLGGYFSTIDHPKENAPSGLSLEVCAGLDFTFEHLVIGAKYKLKYLMGSGFLDTYMLSAGWSW